MKCTLLVVERDEVHTQLIEKNCNERCQNVLCWPTSFYYINGNILKTDQHNICPGRLYMTVISDLECRCFEFEECICITLKYFGKNILKLVFVCWSFCSRSGHCKELHLLGYNMVSSAPYVVILQMIQLLIVLIFLLAEFIHGPQLEARRTAVFLSVV
jgi:hypothetical protein